MFSGIVQVVFLGSKLLPLPTPIICTLSQPIALNSSLTNDFLPTNQPLTEGMTTIEPFVRSFTPTLAQEFHCNPSNTTEVGFLLLPDHEILCLVMVWYAYFYIPLVHRTVHSKIGIFIMEILAGISQSRAVFIQFSWAAGIITCWFDDSYAHHD